MKKNLFFSFLFSLFFALLFSANAQFTNSPFSRIGMGELNPAITTASQGMGGTGVSFGSLNGINIINPALLSRHRYAAFEASAGVEYKRMTSAGRTQQDFRGNLRQLDFAFPALKNLTLGAGMQPFTLVNYNATLYDYLEGTPHWVRYRYKGTGGLTQAYLAAGYSPIKNLSVGLRINYNFGAASHEAEANIDDLTAQYIVGSLERYTYGDLSYQLGAHYSLPLTKDRKRNTSLNFGATYDLAADLSMTRFQALQRKTGDGALVRTDTIARDESSTHYMPQRIQGGIALQKSLTYTLAAEFSMQPWSEASGTTRLNGLADAFSLGLGWEFIPEVSSVTSYLKRVAYRTGFRYAETPWTLNGQQVQDYSLSIGASFPVGRLFSSLNTAFVVGQRSAGSDGGLTETYFRASFGALINGRWFVKRRYD